MEWQEQANCKDMETSLFFPDYEATEAPRPSRAELAIQVAIAQGVCRDCLVRSECLEFGMRQEYGIFGGLTPSQRDRLRTPRKVPA